MNNENLYALFESRFPRDRGAPLLHLPNGDILSYGQAEETVARFASTLVSLGLVPGDRLCVQVEKSPEALLLYLACLRAGLVYLPLNSAYHEREVSFFLDDASPRAVIAQPSCLPWLEPLAARQGIRHVLTLDAAGQGTFTEAARAAASRFTTVACGPDDLAAILYTSGTTGRSRGAMITHRNLASNAQVLHAAWGFGPADVLIHMLPLFHVHGLFVASHCVLMNGTAMRFHPRFDARRAIAEFATSTVFMGVPTFYTRLLHEPVLGRGTCARMRLFLSGSAPLLAETHFEFEDRTGHRILERYGMTETGMLTSNPLAGERRAGSVGPALPGIEVRVVNDDGPCPAGTIGHVHVRGANVFRGYWRMPARGREEFTRDAFFRTGDIGSLSADGYLSIVGRSKDLIITGGYNVYPREVELAIDELPGVLESAVVGVPHPDFGEAVTAIVVASADPPAPTEESVISALKERLANFKVPKRVYVVEELPRNAMGKVQKNMLRERFGH